MKMNSTANLITAKEGNVMARNISESFLRVEDVMEILGVKQSSAYKVIRTLNKELEAKKFMTFNGRVSRDYFFERFHIPDKAEEQIS